MHRSKIAIRVICCDEKRKDHLAAVSPESDWRFVSDSESGCLPLPAPAEQAQTGKPGGEGSQRRRSRRCHRVNNIDFKTLISATTPGPDIVTSGQAKAVG